MLTKFTMRPRENLLVEDGVEYSFFLFLNHKDFNKKIHHETMRKSCVGVGLGTIILLKDHRQCT